VLVQPREGNIVADAGLGFVLPDGGPDAAHADFVDRLVFAHCHLLVVAPWCVTRTRREGKSAPEAGVPTCMAQTSNTSTRFVYLVPSPPSRPFDESVDVIAPSKLGKGGWDVRSTPKPFVGTLRVKARPVAPDQRLEASLASRWGNPPGEG